MIREGSVPANPEQHLSINEIPDTDFKMDQGADLEDFINSSPIIESEKLNMIDKISSSLGIDSDLDMIEKGPNSKEIKIEPSESSNIDIDISTHPIKADDSQTSENVHEGLNYYTCASCDKKYTQAHNLRLHIKIVHEGQKAEKKYKCSLCDWTFTQSHSLKSHLKSHESKNSRKSKKSSINNASKFMKPMTQEPNTSKKISNYEIPKQLKKFKNSSLPKYVWGNPWGSVTPDGIPWSKNSITCEYCKKVFNFKDRKQYSSEHIEKCKKYHQYAIGGKMCKFCGKNNFRKYGKLLQHIEKTHFTKNNDGGILESEKIITNNSEKYEDEKDEKTNDEKSEDCANDEPPENCPLCDLSFFNFKILDIKSHFKKCYENLCQQDSENSPTHSTNSDEDENKSEMDEDENKSEMETEFKIDDPRSIEEQIFENHENESNSEPFDTDEDKLEYINLSSSSDNEENITDSNPNTIQNNSNNKNKDEDLSDFQYFQSNINDFKENKMHKDVLFRLIKDWTANDMKNMYVLKEFILLKEENERLRCENKIILENQKSIEKKKIKTEVDF